MPAGLLKSRGDKPRLFLAVAAPLSAFVVSAFSTCAGGGQTVPTSPMSSNPSPTFPGPIPANAVLAITRLTVDVVPPTAMNPAFYYGVKFRLTETGRRSGATIQYIQSFADDGSSEFTGPECWRKTIKVAPGETLDTFEAGWTSLGYCAPALQSRTETSRVIVLVVFTDDEGRTGTIQATATPT